MASLQLSPLPNRTLLPISAPKRHGGLAPCYKRGVSFFASSEQSSSSPISDFQDNWGRREIVSLGVVSSLLGQIPPPSFAAETKKGFITVTDNKDKYSFVYPFGWQEVAIEGQDKVFKDVIEPLESVSVNIIPTSKQDIREFGPPQQVAETLIKKVLAPPTQKTTLVESLEHDDDKRTYYTFEFTAQAKNFSRHALSTIAVANGKLYILTTGANQRRWEKMKDKLHTVTESFKITNA